MIKSTRRRTVAAAAALALTAGMAAALGATTAQADTTVVDGEFDWGFRANFRTYVGSQTAAMPPLGAAPVGSRIVPQAPATFDASGTPSVTGNNETLPYTFPVTGQTVTPTDLNVQASGGVTYNFPSHTFRITFANPNVVVSGSTKQILADVTVVTVDSTTGADTGTNTTEDVAIADVATVNTTVAGDGMSATITGSGVNLSSAGAAALNDYLTAGSAMDDFSVTVDLEDPVAEVPTVTVDKTVVDPAGDTVTVTGSGFDPASSLGTRPPLSGQESGAYVVFGKFAHVWQPSLGSTTAPSSGRKTFDTKWAVPAASMATIGGAAAGAIELTPEGTFTATLNVKRDFTPSTGTLPDPGNYGIYTYPGSGGTNAAFETYTPITFTAATATSPSQGAVVEPGDTVSVSGTGFNADETVDVILHSTPTDIGDLVADEDGNVSGSVTIPSGTEFGSHSLYLEGQTSGVNVLAATFTVTDASAMQTITTTVSEVGALSMSIPSNDPVVLGTPELSADILSLETDGAINTVNVTDTRIADPGWTVTGVLSDFAGPEVVDGSALNWTPQLVSSDAVTGQVVNAGPAAGDLTGAGATLAVGSAGAGRGSAQLGADIELVLPTTVEPGTYTATLTLTAV
jgi:hypothetical protein